MSRYIIISIGVCRTVWMCVSLCMCPRVCDRVLMFRASTRIHCVSKCTYTSLNGYVYTCVSLCVCVCVHACPSLNYMIYSFYTRRTQERKRMSFAMRFREDGRFLVETGISRFRFVILSFLRVHIDDLYPSFSLSRPPFSKEIFRKGDFRDSFLFFFL